MRQTATSQVAIRQPGSSSLAVRVYRYWDSAKKAAAVSLAEDNKLASSSTSDRGVKGILGHTSGDRYFEIVPGGTSAGMIGIANAAMSVDTWLGSDANGCAVYTPSGTVYPASVTGGFGSTPAGTPIGVAVSFSRGKVWFSRAGAFGSGQDPVANVGGFALPAGGILYPATSFSNTGHTSRLRTAATELSGPLPTGYVAWDEGVLVQPPPPGSYYTDDDGNILTDDEGNLMEIE